MTTPPAPSTQQPAPPCAAQPQVSAPIHSPNAYPNPSATPTIIVIQITMVIHSTLLNILDLRLEYQ